MTETAPPHDANAEQAVLGACMLAPAVVDHVRAVIPDPAAFYRPPHQAIYTALLELADADAPTDPIALADHLGPKAVQRVGGASALHDIYAAAVATDPLYHARIVAGHARVRHAQQAAARLTQRLAEASPDEIAEVLESARDDLDKVRDDVAAASEPVDTTWAPLDLTNVVAGGTLTDPPSLLARDDTHCLLYPGKTHSISGESESGKTWLLLASVADLVHAGRTVVYLDFEDAAEGIVARLRALGCHPEHILAHLRYIRPDTPLDDRARAHLTRLLADDHPPLVVIDGVTEAMTIHGLDPLDNRSAAEFFANLPRFIARHGPAVALIDHVPKDEERNKRYAIGAQHKLAGLDGAAYIVELVRPFGVGQHGIARVRVAKDRPGRVREHAVGGVMADLHLRSESDGSVFLNLRSPRPYDEDKPFRPTHLMERVSRFVEANPDLSKNIIENSVRGNAAHLRLALEMLIREGYVQAEKGANRAIFHTSAKPYRENEEGSGRA